MTLAIVSDGEGALIIGYVTANPAWVTETDWAVAFDSTGGTCRGSGQVAGPLGRIINPCLKKSQKSCLEGSQMWVSKFLRILRPTM